jgi:hypothetical protein
MREFEKIAINFYFLGAKGINDSHHRARNYVWSYNKKEM